MKILPQSELKLYRDVETSRPLAFSSVASKVAYFTKKLAFSFNDFTVVKRSASKVRVELGLNAVNSCNYLSFKNPAFENIVFYARIFDYEYINNDCTEISFGVDYWYTFCHNVDIRSGMIDREHLSVEDYLTSVVNPFAPIPELRTAESLEISRDLEPYFTSYEEANANGSDFEKDPMGVHLLREKYSVDAVGGRVHLSPGTLLTIYMTEVTPPSEEEQTWWNNFLGCFDGSVGTDGEYAMFAPTSANESTLVYNLNFYNKYLAAFLPEGGYENYTINTGVEFPRPYYVFIIPYPAMLELFRHVALWGAVSSIIGVYAMPKTMLLSALKFNEKIITGRHPDLDVYSLDMSPFYRYMGSAGIDSAKLYQFPYSYLRITTPNGDEKELHYENFLSLGDPNYFDRETSKPELLLNGNVVTTPRVDVMPIEYRSLGLPYNSVLSTETSDRYDKRANSYEKVTFKALPQVPYMTDSYLTYLSSVANTLMRDNTQMKKLEYQSTAADLEAKSFATDMSGVKGLWDFQDIVKAGPGAGPVGTGVNIGVEALGNTANLYSLATQQDNITRSQQQLLLNAQMYNQSDDLSIANLENNAIVMNNPAAKRSFACSDYHAGSIDGVEYLEDVSTMDFLVTRVVIRKDILQKYDMYFKAYGYNSGRTGIPRIAAFLKGSVDDSEIPYFSSFERDDNGHYLPITYIKTRNIDIHCPFGIKIIEDYFKAMFNGGQQFINGDMLLSSEGNNV